MLRIPMRWCRSQKPAKSTASIFPVVTGCHRARAICNASNVESFDAGRLHDRTLVDKLSQSSRDGVAYIRPTPSPAGTELAFSRI